MNINYIRNIIIFFITIIILPTCSTSKNTSMSRAYHNLTAHYNVYFNGNESLKSGNRKMKKMAEDYSRILPVFRYENKDALNQISAEMDVAIQKCAKTIKSHSITAKPKGDKKGFSQKEVDFYNKAEYCRWIDDAYLLMGKAHFYKTEFETAKQTFLMIINKYSKENSKDEALLWLAKTYTETKEYKSAENTLTELKKNKRYDKNFIRECDLVSTSMFMKQKDYHNAAMKLNAVLDCRMNKNEKARLYFLLAQIYQQDSKYQLAIDNYNKVIKMNPNYDISFRSKINLAEIYQKSGGNAADLKKQFAKLLKDEKNIDYHDQLYYALGKIEENEKNITKAIEFYQLSSSAKSSNKTQKTKTYLSLAELYFSTDKYDPAEKYFDSTISTIEIVYPDYETVYPQIKKKKALATNLNIIQTEDSLQAFAKLPEKDRNAIIDGLIQKVREQEQKALEAKQGNKPDPFMDNDYFETKRTNQGEGSNYYFYNPNNVSYGQTEFKKKWGDRKLEDNWRRSNKQAVLDNQELSDVADKQAKPDSSSKEKKVANTKSRDFYLQNVPITVEKLALSDKKIELAYINSGNIYYQDFNETSKAVGQFEKLLTRYPNTKNRLEILQKVHTIYVGILDNTKADKYKQMIINEFPESMYAKMLSDPTYIQKIRQSEQEVEKLYQTAYERYNKKEYIEAIGYCEHAIKTFPENSLLPEFIYLKAIALGESGNKEGMKQNLEIFLAKYPNDEVSERARAILDIMKGRKMEEKVFLSSFDSIHHYVFVFQKEKTDVNKLKFKFISLNAKEYTQEDLKISIQSLDAARDMLIIRSFKNSKPAMAYYEKVINQDLLKEYAILAPFHFVISNDNLQVYLKNPDDKRYQKFFEEQYLKK